MIARQMILLKVIKILGGKLWKLLEFYLAR